MAKYRIYALNDLSKRCSFIETNCENDSAAEKMARMMIPAAGGCARVWNGTDLIATVRPLGKQHAEEKRRNDAWDTFEVAMATHGVRKRRQELDAEAALTAEVFLEQSRQAVV